MNRFLVAILILSASACSAETDVDEKSDCMEVYECAIDDGCQHIADEAGRLCDIDCTTQECVDECKASLAEMDACVDDCGGADLEEARREQALLPVIVCWPNSGSDSCQDAIMACEGQAPGPFG